MGLLTEIFLHKLLGMLNAWLRGLLQAHAFRALASLAAIAQKSEHHENPYTIDVSDKSEKDCTRRCAMARRAVSSAPLALRKTQDLVLMRASPRFTVQKHWFFYRAVVIPMQCSRSPRALDDIATHSRLGGQHGEEAKEDGEGSEEGRQEDKAPEEEVSARRASVFDFERRR
jgi:hypothetical protein